MPDSSHRAVRQVRDGTLHSHRCVVPLSSINRECVGAAQVLCRDKSNRWLVQAYRLSPATDQCVQAFRLPVIEALDTEGPLSRSLECAANGDPAVLWCKAAKNGVTASAL